MAGNEVERSVNDGKNFQCAVLKAYEANTKVSAFCHLKRKMKGNHTTAVCRSPKPFMGVRIPLPLLDIAICGVFFYIF